MMLGIAVSDDDILLVNGADELQKYKLVITGNFYEFSSFFFVKKPLTDINRTKSVCVCVCWGGGGSLR